MTKRQRLHAAQQGLCFYCDGNLPITAATLDHVVPRASGGGSSGNTVLACKPCNQAKNDRAPTEAEVERCRRLYAELRASGLVDLPQPERKRVKVKVAMRWASTAAVNRAVLAARCECASDL